MISSSAKARARNDARPSSFTMIAATTRVALISSPLRSRFSGGTFRLEFYTEDEIEL